MKKSEIRAVLVCLSFISGIILGVCLDIALAAFIPMSITESTVYGIIHSAALSFVKNLLILIIVFSLWEHGKTLRSIREGSRQNREKNIGTLILYICSALVLCVLFNLLLSTLGLSGGKNSYTAVDLISLALIPAVIEEISYRYIIFGCFEEYGAGCAVIMSAALFALSHTSLVSVIYAFLCGLVLGYLFKRTHSLGACIMVHFLNNAISIIANC